MTRICWTGPFLLSLSFLGVSGCSTDPNESGESIEHDVSALRERFTLKSLPAPAGFEVGWEGPSSAIPDDDAVFIRIGDDLIPTFPDARDSQLGVTLHHDLSVPSRLSSDDLEISVQLQGATEARGRISGGALVFDRALGETTTYLQIPVLDGFEDFLVADAPLAGSEIRYRIDVSQAGGLRLVDDAVEILDATSNPRIRMNSPIVVGSNGETRRARTRIEDCRYDDNPAAPWDREPVRPMASFCTVAVDWSDVGALKYPILIDPTWTNTTTPVLAPRFLHRSELLPSDKVLVAGGFDGITGALASASIYNPSTNNFATTGPMFDTRFQFGMARVTNGSTIKILAAGGQSSTCSTGYCSSSEVYNESTGIWTNAGTMSARHSGAPLVALKDGSGRAIIAGGIIGPTGSVTNTADIYDPVSGWSTASGTLFTPRYWHSASALSSSSGGRVIFAGGNDSSMKPLTNAEVFNPATGQFSSGGSLPSGSAGGADHAAVVAAGDHVLVIGALKAGTRCLGRGARYNPATNSWSVIASRPYFGCFVEATLLESGKVLTTGGYDNSSVLSTVGLYDPVANTWSPTTSLNAARYRHSAILFPSSPSSKVLVTGGLGSSSLLAGGEYYTP